MQVLSAFCCFSSLLSFWLPWIYSPFPFFMEFRNDVLLQLVECIESTQNEVKRKMIETDACNGVPKSPGDSCAEKNCMLLEESPVVSCSPLGNRERPSTKNQRPSLCSGGHAIPSRPGGQSPATARTSSMSAAIYNEDDFVERILAEGAFLWPVRMML